jgi:hypothetical protein
MPMPMPMPMPLPLPVVQQQIIWKDNREQIKLYSAVR